MNGAVFSTGFVIICGSNYNIMNFRTIFPRNFLPYSRFADMTTISGSTHTLQV